MSTIKFVNAREKLLRIATCGIPNGGYSPANRRNPRVYVVPSPVGSSFPRFRSPVIVHEWRAIPSGPYASGATRQSSRALGALSGTERSSTTSRASRPTARPASGQRRILHPGYWHLVASGYPRRSRNDQPLLSPLP